MKTIRFGYLFLILIFLLPVSLGAMDFGVLVNQYAGLENSADEEDNIFEYRAGVVPRVEFFFRDTGSFFTSASMTIGYNNSLEKKFSAVPELLRTEFSIRFGAFGIRAGRFNYSDPLSFVANGLLDGVQFSHSSQAGRFSLGAWYAGLLYKKNINITMTADDQERYNVPFEYNQFSKTYFAPRRLVGSIDWEHPSIAELLQIKVAITGQMDLTKNEDKYHSQYLTFKANIPFNDFMFEAGSSIEVSQTESSVDDTVFNLAMAGDIGFYWTLPTNFNSRLSFSGRFASGNIGKSKLFSPFIPITTRYYGEIFKTKMSAVTVFALDYSARFFKPLGVDVSASYFIRNNKGLDNNYVITSEVSKNGLFLGSEFFSRIIWNPFSDLQFNLGGGVFIPKLGNVWKDEKLRWRVDLTAILSVY